MRKATARRRVERNFVEILTTCGLTTSQRGQGTALEIKAIDRDGFGKRASPLQACSLTPSAPHRVPEKLRCIKLLRRGQCSHGGLRLESSSQCAFLPALDLRTDDVDRQGFDAQQRLRTARWGVRRAHPSLATHAFAPCYDGWRISQGFVEGAPR